MSETLSSKTPEGSQAPNQLTKWDSLANPNESWEEHLKKAREAYTAEDALRDVVTEQTINETQKTFANDVTNIMKVEAESKKNKADYETDINFQQNLYTARRNHENVIRNERIQEILEKDLNRRLIKVEQLKDIADVDGSGVNKSETDYYGKKIDILNVDLGTYQGEPLNLLTHSIDFKQNKIHQVLGQGTSNALRALPNIWLNRETPVEQFTEDGLYKDGYNVRSNVIFTTYSNPENHNSKPVGGDIIYGFDHVDANSILKLSERDGNTPLILDYRLNAPYENKLDFFNQVENGASNGSYNEVTIRRYDETGKPKLPDYLLVYNGHISEDAKNHAATFKIPIINLNRQ
ncbi:hypothetical protein IKG24_00920 [Candidatus Saccharibacteria bacterium]|nr:hypothetical protein [Candidatus Saccharibacteria bacterium]